MDGCDRGERARATAKVWEGCSYASGDGQWMARQEGDRSWKRDCKAAKRKKILEDGVGREVREPRKSE